MTDVAPEGEQEWPTHCRVCGTRMATAVVDFDKTNEDRPEMRPGEMAAVDYCPNPDCPSHAEPANEADVAEPAEEAGSAPGSMGGDNGGA